MVKKLISIFMIVGCFLGIMGCGSSAGKAQNSSAKEEQISKTVATNTNTGANMVLIKGGTFMMGSPESEPWRGKDEIQHKVTVSDFYMSPYELTQKEYQEITGKNPSNFKGDNLPVENITWLDAIAYCNARSAKEGLKPVYTIQGNNVTWDKAANGYRLPTEAEWEYACRANTTTPFNTENSISVDEANYY
ncbi:MAG: formylglycine-generating enzyme family protein, partial [Phascolarctobacterium sp.]|nr:formylglycine-generating enzyme family protein [Phascolarctobacterium sp.]